MPESHRLLKIWPDMVLKKMPDHVSEFYELVHVLLLLTKESHGCG